MTPNEYQELAMRTCGQSNFVDMIINAGLSLPEEVGEVIETVFYSPQPQGYTATEIQKELGDTLWYMTELCQALDWSLVDFVKPVQHVFSLRQTVDLLAIHASKIGGITKKYVFHQHELDRQALEVHLHGIISSITLLCIQHRITLEEVMEANIAKLKRRYPQGFSFEASKNRQEKEMNT